MHRPAICISLFVWTSALAAAGAPPKPQPTGLDTKRIEQLTGASGTFDPQEGAFKVAVPRADLAVTAAGVRLTPAFGLTSWAAFKRAGAHTVVMGDVVLTEEQVNPTMSVALDHGLEVTALHNHFFADAPKVVFMHIGGMGDEAQLATAVGKTLAKSRESRAASSAQRPTIDPAKSSLDPQRIDAVLGTRGDLKDGVYKVVFGRTTTMHEQPMGKTMGVNTWAAFVGSNEQAVVSGDFAVLEGELQEVLKALRRAEIDVVAIHNHMTHEEPRLVFVHFWGTGSAARLAEGVRSVLAKTAS